MAFFFLLLYRVVRRAWRINRSGHLRFTGVHRRKTLHRLVGAFPALRGDVVVALCARRHRVGEHGAGVDGARDDGVVRSILGVDWAWKS